MDEVLSKSTNDLTRRRTSLRRHSSALQTTYDLSTQITSDINKHLSLYDHARSDVPSKDGGGGGDDALSVLRNRQGTSGLTADAPIGQAASGWKLGQSSTDGDDSYVEDVDFNENNEIIDFNNSKLIIE